MKFLYFTDMHIKGINPGKRKDTFYLTILKKLMEIGHVIQDEKINFVMVGGDLFDSPKISNQLLGEVAKIIKSWKVKVFVVPGNHDVYGQNISTLPHTSLGILERTGVVSILTRDVSPLYIGKRNDPNYPLVAFTGQEYYQDIDTGLNNDYEIEHSVADINILVAHGMLLEKPFHPDIAHTLIQDVTTGADLVLSGHYHPDAVDVTIGSTRFMKPRSAARLEATKHNINHMPQYLIVDIEKQNNQVTFDCDMRDFTWAPAGNEIFDYDAKVEENRYKNELKVFKEQIKNINLGDATKLTEMIKKIASSDTNVTMEHLGEALNYLTDSEKNSKDTSLNGFIAENVPVWIEKVEITHFQSHDRTVVHFKPDSLNALVGESNNGKTAILRAIIWAIYNEPKGSDYIKEGEKFAEVSITFSNQKKLTRRRTNSDTGYFEVEDLTNTKKERYSKFGTTIPIQIANVHQMPKVPIAKDIVSLNIARQLDGPFMLSMSGADRAAAIGKITKTDIADNAILAISKDIVNLQRNVKQKETDCDLIEKKIASFDYLAKENQLLIEVENFMNDSVYHTQNQQQFTDLKQRYNESLVETQMMQLKVDNAPDTNAVDALISNMDKHVMAIQSYTTLSNQYTTCVDSITYNEKQVASAPNVEAIEKLVSEATNRIEMLDKLVELQKAYTTCTSSIQKGEEYISNIAILDEEKIAEIESHTIALEKLIESKEAYLYYENNLKKANDAIVAEEAYINKNQELIEKTQTEYKEALLEMGTCPICGNHIDEHSNFDL